MNEWVNKWTDRIRILTNNRRGTSLVVQWIRIHLLIQGTQVWSLVWEESMCRGATKPVHQDFWTCVPRARAPQQEKRPQWEACTWPRGVAPVSPQPENARTQPPRPAATKNKYIKKKNDRRHTLILRKDYSWRGMWGVRTVGEAHGMVQKPR